MRDYVIMTDSCCDHVCRKWPQSWALEVLPLSLQMGERAYRNYLDGREIGFHEFYEPDPLRRAGHHLRRQRGGI